MRGILTGRKGLAPTLLVIVIVWALAAVLMLTGTLVAAKRIDRDVDVIRPEVNNIGTDTRGIKLAIKTANISKKINDAAQPLAKEASDTLGAARTIDTTAKSILKKAGSIHNVVGDIGTNVQGIRTTVNAIGANASSINSNVVAINRSAKNINASARSINSDARAINASVVGIRSRGSGILTTIVRKGGINGQAASGGINTQVAGINRRAVTARKILSSAGADLAAVRGIVPNINSSANGIDCSTLINVVGPTQGCSRTRSGRRMSPNALKLLLLGKHWKAKTAHKTAHRPAGKNAGQVVKNAGKVVTNNAGKVVSKNTGETVTKTAGKVVSKVASDVVSATAGTSTGKSVVDVLHDLLTPGGRGGLLR